jgi:hypothetical protein
MGRTRRGLVLLLLGAALAVAGAACGGGGSSSGTANGEGEGGFTQYETQMQALGNTLAETLMSTGTANRTATDAQIKANLRKNQRALRAAASKLEKITPPPEAAAGHALLRKGVLEYADEIDGLITQLAKGNKQAVYQVTALKGVKDMTKGTQAISKAGYIIVLGG